MLLGLLADAENVVATQAATTANTSIIISVCTVVVVPLITLFIQKVFESRKQTSEAISAKAKLEGEAMLAKAKLDAEAGIARAKLELDSKLTLLSAQHRECLENHSELEKKLAHCEEQHVVSEEDRRKMWEKIEKLQAVFDRAAERDQQQSEKAGSKPIEV